MKNLLAFLILLFFVNCSAQNTDYSRIPKRINKQIQKNYERNNIFYHYFPEYKNTLTIWKYENGKVKWYSFNNNRISKSGEFDSEIKSDSLSIYATNTLLQIEITKLNEDYSCNNVLDGSTIGYVYSIDNKEIIGNNSISTTTCFKNTTSMIARDFGKIFHQIYKIK